MALVGGGSDPRPGEISLAHHGVLFLDELPEWDRRVLEALREPLESGVIHISRAARRDYLPGAVSTRGGDESLPVRLAGPRERTVPVHAGARRALSLAGLGPLLDRIDLAIDVPAVLPESLALNVAQPARGAAMRVMSPLPKRKSARTRLRESSATARMRVERSRGRQRDRQGKANARSSRRKSRCIACRKPRRKTFSRKRCARMALSARAYHRILKVARTIADLAECERISVTHVAEAIGYRRCDNS